LVALAAGFAFWGRGPPWLGCGDGRWGWLWVCAGAGRVGFGFVVFGLTSGRGGVAPPPGTLRIWCRSATSPGLGAGEPVNQCDAEPSGTWTAASSAKPQTLDRTAPPTGTVARVSIGRRWDGRNRGAGARDWTCTRTRWWRRAGSRTGRDAGAARPATFGTTTAALLALADWLARSTRDPGGHGSTGVY